MGNGSTYFLPLAWLKLMCSGAGFKNGVEVHFKTKITISECAGRALDALVGYGDDAFIEAFKKNLGTHYIRDHEKGLKEFFSIVRKEVIPQLHTVDNLRKMSNLPCPDGGYYQDWQVEKARKDNPPIK